MISLFLLLGCNLSYIVDLFAALHELASASARTLLKLASSVRARLKPYWATLMWCGWTSVAWNLVLQLHSELFVSDQFVPVAIHTVSCCGNLVGLTRTHELKSLWNYAINQLRNQSIKLIALQTWSERLDIIRRIKAMTSYIVIVDANGDKP